MRKTVITKKVLKKPSEAAMKLFTSTGKAPKPEYITTTFTLHNDFPQADVHIQNYYEAFSKEPLHVSGNSEEEFVRRINQVYGAGGRFKAHL